MWDFFCEIAQRHCLAAVHGGQRSSIACTVWFVQNSSTNSCRQRRFSSKYIIQLAAYMFASKKKYFLKYTYDIFQNKNENYFFPMTLDDENWFVQNNLTNSFRQTSFCSKYMGIL